MNEERGASILQPPTTLLLKTKTQNFDEQQQQQHGHTPSIVLVPPHFFVDNVINMKVNPRLISFQVFNRRSRRQIRNGVNQFHEKGKRCGIIPNPTPKLV